IKDEPVKSSGRVVIDMSHDNHLFIDDLTPLRDRLTARGLEVSTLTDSSSAALRKQLRGAKALVVIAPTSFYTQDGQQVIRDFVADGGYLLIAADPTRPIPPRGANGLDLYDLFFPNSAIPAVNSLANQFGVVYFDDYIYNLEDNQDNYRNVKMSVSKNADHPLTDGLETVVFFAAHSMSSEGTNLFANDEDLRSPLRRGESNLVAASLTSDDRVLALGDMTFLTTPYHNVADNDKFLSNIADWLASAERDWDLSDSPYLFHAPVDLVQLTEGNFDPYLVSQFGGLKSAFAQFGVQLFLREKADSDHDIILVGTFEDTNLIKKYLKDAGVTIKLVDDKNRRSSDDEKSRLVISGMGTIELAGSTLFIEDHSGDNVVVIVLAEELGGAVGSLGRLVNAEFASCVQHETVRLCAGDVSAPTATGGSPRLGSKSESQAAIDSQVPSLERLADDSSESGNTFTYFITMQQSQDALWGWGWCATTQELLEENLANITLTFTLNGETISQDRFVSIDDGNDSWKCRIFFVLLTDWPVGEHTLSTGIVFEDDIFDGEGTIKSGTYKIEYIVDVRG
ncbi:MAG: DUF4350 domain-containing protein, partial [Anaerolineae bacterium]|nr:DUF4350 domain-containing protein [Anaerolineae bacterium]